MSYPLVIFGAGASYDYSSVTDNDRPISPLTKNLVDTDFLMPDLLESYEGAGNLLGDMIGKVRNEKKSFEEALTEIYKRKSTKSSVTTQRQFIALEFYLQELFSRISNPEYTNALPVKSDRKLMQEINNYRTILNRIYSYSGGKACIVTFNYDSLLESSLPTNLQPEKMEDYISGDIKVIKLHGSHDWRYLHRKSRTQRVFDSAFDLCVYKHELLAKIQKSNKHPAHHIEEIKERATKRDFYKLPALAIPLTGKDRYVCPERHTQSLKSELSKIDRVLIIGWRAGDPLLLEILKNKLTNNNFKILVVSGTKSSANEIADIVHTKIGASPGVKIEARGGGFSNFADSEASNDFFEE